MFGSYRYLLAHMVVIAHFWTSLTFWTGTYAVFSFYLLSGFLMCMVLNTSYGFTISGICRFLFNRALRVYPPYLVVVASTSAFLFSFQNFALSFNELLRFPFTSIGWVQNIFIFGINGPLAKPRLIPPSWSLDVELSFYVAMAVLLARNRTIATVWFALSVAYTIFLVLSGAGMGERFSATYAGSLPFSMGAMLFFYRNYVPAAKAWRVAVAVSLFLANAVTAEIFWRSPWAIGPFYLSLFFSFLVVASLMNIDRDQLPDWLTRLDDRLGDLSYPIFLSHWLVMGIVVNFLFGAEKPPGATLFFSSILFINLIAYAIHLTTDRYVNRLRTRIRSAAISSSQEELTSPAQ